MALDILPITSSPHNLYFLLIKNTFKNILEGANSSLGSDIKQQRLKLLNISGSDMSKVVTMVMIIMDHYDMFDHFKVDPKLLARAVVNLKEITLTYTCLTKYGLRKVSIAMQHFFG